MFKLAVVGTVAAVASATSHPVNQDIVNYIKEKATTWVPHEVHENPLANLSTAEVFGLLGAKVGESGENTHYQTPTIIDSLPENFDSRDQWPGSVHAIR